MSKISGKTARRYAKALFDAIDKAELDVYSNALSSLGQLVENSSDLKEAVSNPAYNLKDKINVASDLVKKIAPSLDKFKNFAALLVENGRFLNSAEISEVFNSIVAEYKKLLSLEVTTAFDINDDEKQTISEKLQKQFGKVSLKWNVDSDILGGMQVSSGDKLYDSSVRGALDALSEKLTKI